jgi:hypothetical protein
MKNKLSDLHNHLFEELGRLNDEDLKGEALQEEITRAKAMTSIASQIIANGQLVLKAQKMQEDSTGDEVRVPTMLTAGE